jgi:hypothetical protein
MQLAGVLRQAGRHEEAEAACRQALEGLLASTGDPHPRVAAAYTLLGQMAGAQSKYSEVGGWARGGRGLVGWLRPSGRGRGRGRRCSHRPCLRAPAAKPACQAVWDAQRTAC